MPALRITPFRLSQRFKSIQVCATVLSCLLPFLINSRSAAAADDGGFQTIFDGKTLDGWDGDPKFWRVEDGAITGETTKANPTKGNTFIVWRGGKTADFELKIEYKILSHNSGIQYRSFELPQGKWRIGGYQADLEAGDKFSGLLYGEKFRGILAPRGEKTVIGDNHKPKKVGSVGNPEELQKLIKKQNWNEYHIIARGFHFIQKINGTVMSECTDEDTKMRRKDGLLALQLHAGPPMKVQFRNIRLKQLKPADTSAAINPVKTLPVKTVPVKTVKIRPVSFAAKAKTQSKKRVLFLAGRKSHGYGAHEHKAGCMLLAKLLEEVMPGYQTTVMTKDWPTAPNAFAGFDSVVAYADGGGGHPFNQRLELLDRLVNEEKGLVCLHYAVEVPKGDSGQTMLKSIGGYFETFWSVNPHWTAHFKKFPRHPTANGVEPFSINDEWYYHMRFPEDLTGVTPILSDLPPANTLRRKDGHHSNNPHVRAAVLERMEPQHVAWAYERPNGGRGFGFTGGHMHWNWGHPQFRKIVLNAIVWTAGDDVPQEGVRVGSITLQDLLVNQDYPKPDDYNLKNVEMMLNSWNK